MSLPTEAKPAKGKPHRDEDENEKHRFSRPQRQTRASAWPEEGPPYPKGTSCGAHAAPLGPSGEDAPFEINNGDLNEEVGS